MNSVEMSVQKMSLPSTTDFSNVRVSEVIMPASSVSQKVPIGNADVILIGLAGKFDGAQAGVEISIDGEVWESSFTMKTDGHKHILWAPYVRIVTKGGTEKTQVRALISRRIK